MQEKACSPLPPLPKLDSQLINLLQQALHGDVRTLGKLACSVQKALVDHQAPSQRATIVSLLVERDEFFDNILFKCLKINVHHNPGVVHGGLWILNTICAVDTSVKFQDKLKILVAGGLVPVLAKLLAVQERHLNFDLLALEVLAHLASWRHELELKSSGPLIVSGFQKIVKSKSLCPVSQLRITQILAGIMGVIEYIFCPGQLLSELWKNAGKHKVLVKNLPKLELMKPIAGVLMSIVNGSDEPAVCTALSLLTFSTSVDGMFQVALDAGFMRKYCQLLDHPRDAVRLLAFTVIASYLKYEGKPGIIKFLKYSKGSMSLGSLFCGFSSSDKGLAWITYQLHLLLVDNLGSEYTDVSIFNCLLRTGLVESLVYCLSVDLPPSLRKDSLDVKVRVGTTWLLGRLSSEVSLNKRSIIVDAGALPYLVEQLKSSSDVLSSMSAITLGNLADGSDKIFKLGAIPLFLKLLERDMIGTFPLVSVLAGLEVIVSAAKEESLKYLKNVPQTLLQMMDRPRSKLNQERLSTGIFSVISKICQLGRAGVDLVISVGWLPTLVSALTCSSKENVIFSLEAVESIARGGKSMQREGLIEAGAVQTLVQLLQNSIKYVRSLALSALYGLYRSPMTPETKKNLLDMMPQVCIEPNKAQEDPRSSHPAGFAYQNALSSLQIHISIK